MQTSSNLRFPVEDEEEEDEEEEEEKSEDEDEKDDDPMMVMTMSKWLRQMALVSKALDSKVYGDAHYVL